MLLISDLSFQEKTGHQAMLTQMLPAFLMKPGARGGPGRQWAWRWTRWRRTQVRREISVGIEK